MSPRKLIRIFFVLAIAIAITVYVNFRFPKYGNTRSDIAHIASEKVWYNLLITGPEVEVYAVRDFGNDRVALVRPFDEQDGKFGFLYFKKNDSGKYEQRGSIIWCPNDMIEVFHLQNSDGVYDIALYNNTSVVLLQRTNVDGFAENNQVLVSDGITPWAVSGYGYTYNCVTSDGLKLPQKR